MRIWLTDEQAKQCADFAEGSAGSQRRSMFGQNYTAVRTLERVKKNTYMGKLAEVAFSTMMKQKYDIDIPLDFEIYPRGKFDKADAIVNNWRIDVKSSHIGSRWLLIDWNHLAARAKENLLPHFYVMALTYSSREHYSKFSHNNVFVDLVGHLHHSQIKTGAPGVATLRRGSKIPGTRTALVTDNYGVAISSFKEDWDDLSTILSICLPDDPACDVSV